MKITGKKGSWYVEVPSEATVDSKGGVEGPFKTKTEAEEWVHNETADLWEENALDACLGQDKYIRVERIQQEILRGDINDL
tara:strand:+ start:419 stop:661 length:243 start_codon:yes stop_codon:yes gene_type:complete